MKDSFEMEVCHIKRLVSFLLVVSLLIVFVLSQFTFKPQKKTRYLIHTSKLVSVASFEREGIIPSALSMSIDSDSKSLLSDETFGGMYLNDTSGPEIAVVGEQALEALASLLEDGGPNRIFIRLVDFSKEQLERAYQILLSEEVLGRFGVFSISVELLINRLVIQVDQNTNYDLEALENFLKSLDVYDLASIELVKGGFTVAISPNYEFS